MADQMSGFKQESIKGGGPGSRLAQAVTQLQSEVPPCAPWEQAEILRARLEEYFSAQHETLQQVLGNFSNTLAHDVTTDLSHVADYAADELLSIAESYRDAPKEAVE